MKISFCMPCYNKEPYLADAIESVLRQTYKDIELVIVDDDSTDGTRYVGEYYAHRYPKKVRYYHNNSNLGVASCRNLAWGLATGDIVCVQDADDLSMNNRATLMNEYFTTHPETQVVYGSCGVTDVFNRKMQNMTAQDFSVFRLKEHNFISHPTVAYRKSLPVQYREGLRYIDDWYFYLDCVKNGVKIEGVLQTLGIYRILPDGLTLKDGFLPKKKVIQRNALIEEFKDLEEDLSEKLKVGKLQQGRVKAIMKEIPKKSVVMDLGCNGGYLLEKLKGKGCKVSGIETSQYLVNICQQKGLSVIKDDVRTAKLTQKFHRIILGDILEHYYSLTVRDILKNALGALKKKGQIIITVPHKHGCYNAKNIPEHKRDYDVDDFKHMFPKNRIKVKYIKYEDYATPIWSLIIINK